MDFLCLLRRLLAPVPVVPESVRAIDGVWRLYYIKARDKVLLIEPNVRTAVGQITAS